MSTLGVREPLVFKPLALGVDAACLGPPPHLVVLAGIPFVIVVYCIEHDYTSGGIGHV